MTSNEPSTSPIKPRRWRKVFRVLLFIGACLLTLLVAFYLVEKARGRAAWQAYEAEARSRGLKLTYQEYLVPPVPDSENFAAIPLFAETFVTPPPGKPTPNPLALPSKDQVKEPSLADSSKGKLIDLVAWQEFFHKTGLLEAPRANAADDVLKALQKYDPTLAQLREASARPRSRFPVRWEDGINAILPHLTVFQSATRIYCLRLAAHLAKEERAEALQDFRGCLRLYFALRDEPVLITGLVRIHVLTVLENAIWSGLAAGQWSDAELRAIETELSRTRLLADYEFAMNSERAACNHIFDTMQRQSGRERAEVLNMGAGGGHVYLGTRGAMSLYPSGWLRLNQVRINRYFDEMLARVTVDPPRLNPKRPVPTNPEKHGSTFERMRYLLFHLFAPALSTLERRYAFAQTFSDQTRIACAIERHRLARGKFPENLDALAPEFLAKIPRDVITGEPLRYRTVDDGQRYTLYSVGFNQTDDGGKTGGKGNAADQPDWVWQYPGK